MDLHAAVSYVYSHLNLRQSDLIEYIPTYCTTTTIMSLLYQQHYKIIRGMEWNGNSLSISTRLYQSSVVVNSIRLPRYGDLYSANERITAIVIVIRP